MGTFGKVFIGLLSAIIVAIVIGAVLLLSNLDAVVKGIIETAGSEATGTTVTVDTVDISLQEGSAAIGGLRISNPAGYGAGQALEIGLAAISLNLEQTASELVVIESILIDGARLSYEQQGSTSNLQAILNNLDSASSGHTSSSAGQDESASGARIIIDDFRFLNAQASFVIPGLGQQKIVKIPDIEISGIGRKSAGVAAAEAARQILEPVIREAMQAAIDGSVDDLMEDLGNDIREKAMQRLDESLGEKDAEKLKGLLNRD